MIIYIKIKIIRILFFFIKNKFHTPLHTLSQPFSRRFRIKQIPIYPPFYGLIRFGSRGNADASLIFFKPKKSITTRSSPTPPPACGNAP